MNTRDRVVGGALIFLFSVHGIFFFFDLFSRASSCHDDREYFRRAERALWVYSSSKNASLLSVLDLSSTPSSLTKIKITRSTIWSCVHVPPTLIPVRIALSFSFSVSTSNIPAYLRISAYTPWLTSPSNTRWRVDRRVGVEPAWGRGSERCVEGGVNQGV